MKTYIALGVVAVLGFLMVSGCGMYVSAHNQEKQLRNLFVAQQETNKASFDKTWKIIQQQTGIAEKERETFRQVYTDIMSETQGVAGNGQLASFFTQAKIDITPDLFAKVMNSIEAQRESFHRDQQRLLDIKREHDDLTTMWPSAFFLDVEPLKAQIVTSTKTDNVFATGKEDLTPEAN